MHLLALGLTASRSDNSPFIRYRDSSTAYLLLYVGDIILMASSSSLLHSVIASLHPEFAMIDLSDLHHFLGVNVQHSDVVLFLS